ncbi:MULTISPECIES: histidine phosphatase family protein [Mycobacterium]|uniref:Histidine phosphatase family protein n=1 Tax=Mycobacterium kiyosense TaxID=2871094 RepID=A0A9P3Q9I6_9MYCO|nr:MULTISPECIES: histidine phosphatase family protein [Mycobacterium]BDE12533.1 histidine phosphatase family protein [Mycobacterium sp. 20KCMC460]GLB91021.1 histidine phosphatase family protein [Mycobacterium kiyosense]GLD19656.1 histidine phosphatase family protein [Mycobacterium kiyosense]GLD33343.1 histidine phosphatase family protein [Mycobacterium kiyosense]GLD38779.1 histidine phosphatase family protein [Mycobacterium kiyosense]
MVMRSMIRTAPKVLTVLVAAVLVGACGGGSPQARSITLTFIRNAQSQANADGIIDTAEPGPGLTPDGQGQAQQLAHQGHNDFDSVYTSPMAADQQTAAPLAGSIGRQAEVVQGLRSINAGWFNGKPESMSNSTYMLAPTHWVVDGDVQNAIPGSINGSDFNSQFSAAIRKIYDSGHHKPVVFSQGNAIMVWTLMNVKNPKTGLLSTHPLPNVGRVVVTGSPTTGWTMVEWDGVRSFS